MKILMIEIPSEQGDGSVPFGLLYAASSAYRQGHDVRIIDLVKNDLGYAGLKECIENFTPGLIGMGGITSSYKNCKELIANIKLDFRSVPIVIGGVITSVSDLLLTKAGVDYVVHGESELSFPALIHALENERDPANVHGISFVRNGVVNRTEVQSQIANLDDIPFPEYSLLDVTSYLDPVDKWIDWYFGQEPLEYKEMRERLAGKRHMLPIITARGCTHKCIFCYRHQLGLRQHSVDYVVSHIKFLHEKYGVDIFQVNDELTTGNKKWILNFCDRLISEDMGIYLIVLSARVDTVDEDMLLRLKEAGCLMINYGYETGSDTVLREIRKGVTRDQALKAGLLTTKAGIKNIPEIIIGFPSETEETVKETIDFLKELDRWPISLNTPIPFPETPLWEYAVKHNIIKDKEEFVLGYGRGRFINLTQHSDRKLMEFVRMVRYDTILQWLWKRKMYSRYIVILMEQFLWMHIIFKLPEELYMRLKKIYHIVFGPKKLWRCLKALKK